MTLCLEIPLIIQLSTKKDVSKLIRHVFFIYKVYDYLA